MNPITPTSGVELIAAERTRQIEVYGQRHQLDDRHTNHALVYAALAYARLTTLKISLTEDNRAIGLIHYLNWPWIHATGKPQKFNPSKDPIRNLVKAGALIAAEIDRLQRAKAKEAA